MTDAPERMTAIFECDLRTIAGNPHHIDTTFGRAVTLSIGDLSQELDAALAERDALEKAAIGAMTIINGALDTCATEATLRRDIRAAVVVIRAALSEGEKP